MRIFLRRERRRNYTILCTWKVFVVFITLLSIGLSMESGLEESTSSDSSKSSEIDIDYERITKVLMNNFNIPRYKKLYCISWDELYTNIKRIENTNQFSIDLKELNIKKVISNEERINQNSESLETILKRIDTIKVKIMYIDTEEVSDVVFSMLIERVVVATELCISGECWWMRTQNTVQSNGKMETNEIDVSLTKKQKKTSIEIPRLIIEKFSECIIEDILEYVKIYTIKTLVIKTDSIKKLTLSQFRAKNVDTVICIQCGSCLESIVFPGNNITKSLSVKLYGLPELKSVKNSIGDSSIPIALKDLYIDRATFKALSLELAAREDARKPINKIFMAQNTFIDYAPYTFQELASDSSIPWIETETVRFLSECDRHDGKLSETIKQSHYLSLLKTIGIQCSVFHGYDVFDTRRRDYEKQGKTWISIYTIQKVKITDSTRKRSFECGSKYRDYLDIYFFKIDLEESKEIQKIIDEFQKLYDMLYAHIYYEGIHILGSKAQNIWFNVLTNTFRWMGQEIRMNDLSFYGMKKLTNSDVKKEKPGPSSIELPKIKFNLTKLCFYDSEISFIKHMFDNYSYTPETTILIDCHKIEEKDFWDLCEKIRKHGFSKVILENSSKIVESMCKNSDQIDLDLRSKIMISKGKPEYLVSLSDIIDCMSLPTSTVFFTHISKLMSNPFRRVSMEAKNKKKDSYCLVSRTMGEACDALSEVMKERGKGMKIDSLLCLDIFIYNYCSNDDSFATIEQVSRVVSLINQIFKKLNTLSLLNLRMKEKEYQNIKTLNTLTYPINKHGLKGLYMRGYIINDDDEEETVLCIKQKKEPCLHDKVEASGKETLETLDYRIGKNRLNQKLRGENIFIDCSAI
ncbi:hypothetical protein NEFER03_2259 [Nematocida sp. LUAm3]|nr:hypothetical protein NEFER03_2259 [Nematocida sp. LUAm3]KAI5176516.1 hypothetical protein NEFER02_2245 [Nematocida sp. LUAm2]KAI5179422.1 hypothetical protein NEFER01_2241 [Nematocida sp. LUAm1]